MSNKNLFKEAIADAKAVREAALANAKAALEEALTPKLQSMLAAKLNEMDYEAEVSDLEDEEEEMEEGFLTSHGDNEDENLDFNLEETDEMDEDFDLSEILAELEEEEMEEAIGKKLNKGGYTGALKDKDETTTVKTAQSDTAYSELSEAKDEEAEDEESEEESVADMSVEDLKDLIKDIIDQEMEAEEAEGPADEEAEEETNDMSSEESSDEINLDELLAELDALGEGDDMEEESMYEAKKKVKKAKEEKEEMKEALATINALRQEMNEVNLLNAKLLYVNKIFKAKNLSESQKLKVIASFDKATTAKEAKVVFESLNTNLSAAPKQAIKESYGFASRAAGTAPRKAIVETNDAITRMQKLANIIK